MYIVEDCRREQFVMRVAVGGAIIRWTVSEQMLWGRAVP
jgi:hypothetical protein